MSDAKLRDLERRWRETRSPDDEAAYLIERQRVGDLSRDKLEIAAYCEHPGARIALRTGSAPQRADDVTWLLGMERFGRPMVVRALSFLAEEALPIFEAAHDSPTPREMLLAARAWCDCPCATHLAALMGGRGLGDLATTRWGPTDESPVTQAAWAVDHVAAAAWLVQESLNPSRRVPATNPLMRPVAAQLASLDRAGLNRGAVMEAMRVRMIEWVLRTSDPEHRTEG